MSVSCVCQHGADDHDPACLIADCDCQMFRVALAHPDGYSEPPEPRDPTATDPRAYLDIEASHDEEALVRALRENRCGDLLCQSLRLNGAIHVLTGLQLHGKPHNATAVLLAAAIEGQAGQIDAHPVSGYSEPGERDREAWPPCPAGCGCRLGTGPNGENDADAQDCACDGPCCWDSWDQFVWNLLAYPEDARETFVASRDMSKHAPFPPLRGASPQPKGLDWLLIFDRAAGGTGSGHHGQDRFAFNARVDALLDAIPASPQQLQPKEPEAGLREALATIEEKAGWADHGSVEDGPAFARGARWAASAMAAALSHPTSTPDILDGSDR